MSPIRLIHLDSIDSTSTHARRLIESDPAGHAAPFVVAAPTQTAGRGTRSRSWASPLGGLWCTLAWPMTPEPGALDALGLRIGLACLRTIDAAIAPDTRARLKWPNDVSIDGRKVLGVLTETIPVAGVTFVLVGVGINVNFRSSSLPPEVATRAISLLDATGHHRDVDQLRESLISHLAAALQARGITPDELDEVRRRLEGVGEPAEIRVSDGPALRGVLLGLGDDGFPLVRTPAGVVSAR